MYRLDLNGWSPFDLMHTFICTLFYHISVTFDKLIVALSCVEIIILLNNVHNQLKADSH